MLRLRTMTVATFFTSITLFGNPLYAKGLDELTPKPNAVPPPSEVDNSQKASEPSDTNVVPSPQEVKEKEIPSKEVKDEPQPTAEIKTEQVKPAERSAISLALDGKLLLSVSLGIGSLKGKEGDWANRGSGSLGFSYLLKNKAFKNKPVYLVFNYNPLDSVIKYKGQTYNAITEGYFGGIKVLNQVKDSLFTTACAQIGYLKNRVSSSDHLKEDSGLERSDIVLAATGALEWKMQEKVFIGPFITVGLGSEYQMYKLGAATSFAF